MQIGCWIKGKLYHRKRAAVWATAGAVQQSLSRLSHLSAYADTRISSPSLLPTVMPAADSLECSSAPVQRVYRRDMRKRKIAADDS